MYKSSISMEIMQIMYSRWRESMIEQHKLHEDANKV